MEKLFKGLAKLIALIFAILFVITLVPTLFLYSFEKNFFNADTYKETLRNENFYERLPAVIGDQLVVRMGFEICAENPVACNRENRSVALELCLEEALGSESYQALTKNERPPANAEMERIRPCFEQYGYPEEEAGNELAPLTKNLTAKDWEFFITALLPPEEIQNLLEDTIDEIFAFFNGDSDFARISLQDFKERLLSDKGLDALLAFLDAQPSCTKEDLLMLTNFTDTGEMIFCNPPEQAILLVKPLLELQLKIIAANIPDERIILRKTDMGSEFLDFQSLRVLIRLSPIIPVVLLLLMTLLAVRSLQTWLRWWGIPLLVAGGLGLIFSLLIGPILQSRLSVAILERTSMEISGSLLQLSHDLLSTITSGFVGNIALSSLVIATFGLGLTLGAVFVKKSEG